jgi:hypothetical protein
MRADERHSADEPAGDAEQIVSEHDEAAGEPMSDQRLETDPIASPASEGAPQTVIVVHDRPHRWSLAFAAPVLVLLSACAILSMRIHAPDWLGLSPRLTTRQKPVAIEPAPATTSSHLDEPAGLPPGVLASGVPAATVDVEAVPDSLTEPAPLPIRPPTIQIVPADRDVAIAALPELAPESAVDRVPRPAVPSPNIPHPEAEEVLAGIQRDSQRQQEERKELERIKGDALDQELAEEAHEDLSARQSFAAELKSIMSQRGPGAADAIRELIDRTPVGNRAPISVEQVARQLSGSRTMRRAWTLQQRALGVSESQILEVLERAQTFNRVARGGPGSDDEALVRAAQELIGLPMVIVRPAPPRPEPPRPANAKPSPARRREGTPMLPPTRRRSPAS